MHIPRSHPKHSLLALRSDGGIVAYRLVMNDPPNESDFEPVSVAIAEAEGRPELIRLGLSHYLAIEGARDVKKRPGSMIAEVTLPRTAHYARTGKREGHIDVWARPKDLVRGARIVE
jgi:hypothetical protein